MSSPPPRALVDEFCLVTGASRDIAEHYIAAHPGFIDNAISAYLEDREEGDVIKQQSSQPSGARTLDGRPAPATAGPSSAAKKPKKRTGVMTLASLSRAADHESDSGQSSSDEDQPGRGDLFAGGEKSGLAVQDPTMNRGHDAGRKIVANLIAKAKANPGREEAVQTPSHHYFSGTGMTLGGEGVESQVVAGSSRNSNNAADEPAVEVTLHLWDEGFSIDDGPLLPLSDPANQATLEMFASGRAPYDLLKVRDDQSVILSVQKHPGKYVPPPKIYKPFAGTGQRLGAPVPGEASSSTAALAAAPAASSSSASRSLPELSIDSSRPTVSIRLQMPDGSRLPARFNTTHTVGDVYDFVARSSPEMSARSFILSTTFPSKDHNDKSQKLEDVPEFKRGGTAVIKWAT